MYYDKKIFIIYNITYLEDIPNVLWSLKLGTPLIRLRRKACSINFCSEEGSILQKAPFPGSSWDRGTYIKYINIIIKKIN